MENRNDRSKPRVSIVVPTYNEEGNVEELCRQFDQMGQSAGFSFEVLLVDDGSTDATGEIIGRLRDRYRFLRPVTHGHNQGLTQALQTGFSLAQGEIFVFYPADLQYRPEDIPKLIAGIDEGNDLVTGWKQGEYSKKFVSTIYNALSRRLFNIRVHDLNSVKAFRREVAEDIFLRKDWHRYLVVLAVERGYRVSEVKIPLYARHSGESKFTGIGRIVVGLLDMLAVKSQLTLLKKPLLFFGLVGTILIGLGIITGLVALYLRLVMDIGFRPLLYLVILLMTLGSLSFILGFLAEGLAAIREELSGVRTAVRRLESTRRTDRPDED